MNKSDELLIFCVDQRRYALPLRHVERVLRMVEPTPPPKARLALLGFVDVEGQVVAALSLREFFGASRQPLKASDRLVLVSWQGKSLALVANEVEGVMPRLEGKAVATEEIAGAGADCVASAIKTKEGDLILELLTESIFTGSNLSEKLFTS